MAEEYRVKAEQTQDQTLRDRLLDIARTCEELAERLERLAVLERKPNGGSAAP